MNRLRTSPRRFTQERVPFRYLLIKLHLMFWYSSVRWVLIYVCLLSSCKAGFTCCVVQSRCLGETQPYSTGVAVFCFLLSCLLRSGQTVHTFRVIFLCFRIRRHNLAFSGIAQGTGAVQAEFRVRCLRVGPRAVVEPETHCGGWGRKEASSRRRTGSLFSLDHAPAQSRDGIEGS